MAVGTGIASLRRNQELRRLQNANLPKGDRAVLSYQVTTSPSFVTVSGTTYPVFVPGVSDPEGTGADLHYIP